MNPRSLLLLVACGLFPALCTFFWVKSAAGRLTAQAAPQDEVAVAEASDAQYCSVELKRVLRRVLQSCGLLGAEGGRGCQPLEAKNVASVSGDDFNALFKPMKNRGAIVQFDVEKSELDDGDRAVIEEVFADQRGASYFFVVARASPDGDADYNRNLSKARAEAVLAHLQEKFRDPDLDREVGLLWLGEEFAQLDREFCDWRRSGGDEACHPRDINRGAFVSWIDCQL